MPHSNLTDTGMPDIQNKHQAISNWVHLYGDTLYTWASHKVSDSMAAQDLVQDTFYSAIQSFETFQGKSNPKTWLFAILNNKIIDYYRKSAKSASELETVAEKKALHMTDSSFNEYGQWSNRHHYMLWDAEPNLLDDSEFTDVLTRCLHDLPTTWRLTMQAKYLMEKDAQDICQELGITPSNYWQVLHRAKLMLKKCIELHWFKK